MQLMICSCGGGVRNLPVLNLHRQNRTAFKSASRMEDCAIVELMICRDRDLVFADAMMFIVGSKHIYRWSFRRLSWKDDKLD